MPNLYKRLIPHPRRLYVSFTSADLCYLRSEIRPFRKDIVECVQERQTHMSRVLLIEDEELLRRILARNLTRRGHTVIGAASAAEAITALRSGGRFDVLLLDVNLPDQTG